MNYESGKEAWLNQQIYVKEIDGPHMVSHCHGLRVCQECYDSALVSAWEAWDAENESDNDNPKVYPADQEVVSSAKLFSFKNTVVRILTSLCLGILMKQGVCQNVLFLDLSSNPEPFEDPKGNKQANTYRKMRDVTDKCWEGRICSFPKTNVLWLQFLEKSSKDKKELRSLKKRLNSYGSAKEAVSDPFFSGLLIEKL
ncbi:hypothetical protein CDL12_22146 [Handroanthus impetiginosus]|uniref:non-specific serine/threonine protein kinase n=1 Tax=Handroanthus impetiginosus TaxID=429701 RepID=A0A2G9GJ35_9LAMI|nr:hypothetical protein CDL12_22146 [Handroanthus impetiginosus]